MRQAQLIKELLHIKSQYIDEQPVVDSISNDVVKELSGASSD